jgi:hypothetical protein
MKEYAKFESRKIKEAKRGLTTITEVMEQCYGYLSCMVDMGIIEEGRKSYEYERLVII